MELIPELAATIVCESFWDLAVRGYGRSGEGGGTSFVFKATSQHDCFEKSCASSG